MPQPIDYYGLVNAIILLITAITLFINLWNQRRLQEMKDTIHDINGNIQRQLDDKQEKKTL